jgi:hypothetical protein
MVVDPVVKPVAPRLPLPIELGHGLVTLFGGETPIIGLTPALPTSVEPSGIAPPLSVEPVPMPALDSGEAVPVAAGVEDVQPGIEVVDAVVVDPPPSNVELVPVIEVELMPIVAATEPLLPEVTDSDDPVDGHGLKPPGSISVAPIGMPVPLEPLEPGMPSGDVAPIPGVTVVPCA